MYEIEKQQGYTVSTGNYNHYLAITYNGVKSAKILNHYAKASANKTSKCWGRGESVFQSYHL